MSEVDALQIDELTANEIDEILHVEALSWVPNMCASCETILKRFKGGHIMLGLRDVGQLIGTVGFVYRTFDPYSPNMFPKTFQAYADPPATDPYDTAYVYSLSIAPVSRGLSGTRKLIQACIHRILSDGCVGLICDARPQSYVGGSQIPPDHEFREAIDSYLAGGAFPAEEIFYRDPTLSLYGRTAGLRPLWIMPNFAPEDEATSGLRIIMYRRFDESKEVE